MELIYLAQMLVGSALLMVCARWTMKNPRQSDEPLGRTRRRILVVVALGVALIISGSLSFLW